MEPTDYLRVLRRRWAVVALATLFGLAAGLLTASDEETPVSYTATQTLSVVQPSILATTPLVSFTPSQLAVYTTVGDVPQQAARALDYPGSPQDLASRITAEPDDTVGVLRISATDVDGARAAEIANTFGRKLRTVIIGQAREDLQAEIALGTEDVDDLQNRVNELDAQIAGEPSNVGVLTAQRDALVNQYRIAYDSLQLLQDRTGGGDPVIILENAVPRRAEQGLGAPKSPPARMALFGFLGLLLGAALALVLDRVDTRIRTKEDAEKITGLPVLSEIPFLPRRHRQELITATRPASPFAEAYRNLRSSLAFARSPLTETLIDTLDATTDAPTRGAADDEPRWTSPAGDGEPTVILVTSSGPYEGKTTTIANLAATYAENNRRVLVLDCDFRRPRLHQVFGTRETPGISDTLRDPRQFSSDREVICETSVEGVQLVPAGTPTDNPARLFNRAKSLIEASRRQADVVLVDTPPYLVANDAAELIPWVDAVVIVVKSRRTRRGPTERMIEHMYRQQAPAVGVVLVGSDQAQSGYSPYYYHRANARTDKARRRWRRALRLGPPKDKTKKGKAPKEVDDHESAPEDLPAAATAPATGSIPETAGSIPETAGSIPETAETHPETAETRAERPETAEAHAERAEDTATDAADDVAEAGAVTAFGIDPDGDDALAEHEATSTPSRS